jgi:hypothetical protein
MMILSRIWYIVLSFLLGMALYIVFLAVGQYNRRNGVAMTEELASDSQTVGWALQIDARKRIDALLIGSVDKGIEDALQTANTKDTIPAKAKEDARRALVSVLDKIPADFKPDALFAVDHDGRVVGQVGYDVANPLADFELGGYPVVFDAIHGFLRDDTWVLGGKLYRVVARPVEFDATQPPLGAIVGLRLVDKKFAQDLSKHTRASIAFYASGQRVVSAAAEGFDEGQLDLLDKDLPNVLTDKEYTEGRSAVRSVSDNVGVMYARVQGDAWDLGSGFAVARTRVTIGDWLGFLNGADDKDKQSVNFPLIGGIVFAGILLGLLLSWLEHSMPLAEMRRQAQGLRKGSFDYFQLPRFRGGLRDIAQDVNAGIERVLEKGGAAVRKPADLESILGPVPAQPSMSAFAFPLADSQPPAPSPRVGPPGGPGGPGGPPPLGGGASHSSSGGASMGSSPGVSSPGIFGANMQSSSGTGATAAVVAAAAAAAGVGAGSPKPPPPGHRAPPPIGPGQGAPIPPPAPGPGFPSANASGATGATPYVVAPRPGGVQVSSAMAPSPADAEGPTLSAVSPSAGGPPKPAPRGSPTMVGIGVGGSTAGAAAMSPATVPHQFPPPGMDPARPAPGPSHAQPSPQAAPPATASQRRLQDLNEDGEDEATVVAPAPSDLIAQSQPGPKLAANDTAEWMTVFDDFVRTKKQCGEPTDGLTFEKFQATLRKNRDALMQRHNCKKVRFSVYVKEGRASLKATPVRD